MDMDLDNLIKKQIQKEKRKKYRDYDKIYNNSEQGKLNQKNFRENNRHLCSLCADSNRIKKLIIKYEERRNQSIKDSDLFRTNQNKVDYYKEVLEKRLKEIEEIRNSKKSKEKN